MALAAAVLVWSAAPAGAEPLDVNACVQLREEVARLERGGARANFSRGPEWAKANMKPEQLGQVDRLLEADAQFLFRCPQPKRVYDAATEAVLEHGTGSDPAPEEPAAAGAATTPAAKKPPPATADKKTAAPPKAAGTAEAGATPAATAKSPAAAKPPAKQATVKPKAKDAFFPDATPKAE